MTLKEGPRGLVITHLPLEDMALLALAVPLTVDLARVLTALLEGKRVAVTAGAMEYKRYRHTAPLAVYQKFVALERQLREMGLVRAGEGEGT